MKLMSEDEFTWASRIAAVFLVGTFIVAMTGGYLIEHLIKHRM
jgi:hypothetical protein